MGWVLPGSTGIAWTRTWMRSVLDFDGVSIQSEDVEISVWYISVVRCLPVFNESIGVSITLKLAVLNLDQQGGSRIQLTYLVR